VLPPALAISVIRANGRKRTASVENGVEPAHVNLVQSVTIPGQKGHGRVTLVNWSICCLSLSMNLWNAWGFVVRNP
jgi:hypothetical protein